MKSLTIRRIRNVAVVIIFAGVLLLTERVMSLALRDTTFASGWLLISMVVLLAIYNVRKKLPFLPLGPAATWLQIHIYVGLLSIVVFCLHIGWRFPNGIFELVLASIFVVVGGSGIAGLILSRLFVRRITIRGPEVLFERIPRLRSRLRRETEDLVFECLDETGSTAIPEFYTDRLVTFFATSRNFGSHLINSLRPRRKLNLEFEAQRRFLGNNEKEFMNRIEDRVMAKDDLDYQHAHRAILRYWLFIHIPTTYALLVFATVHGILVYAF